MKTRQERRAEDARRRPPAILRWSLALVLAGLGLGGALAIAVALTPLPSGAPPQATRVYDRDGRLIGSWFAENRVAVTSAQIPRSLKDAAVAIEDERFYRHHGVDPRGVARALWIDLRAGGAVAGGSTITQQLAKNLYLTPSRTVMRKAEELVLALKLEQTYSKDEILTMYLNDIYFGDAAWGVEAASEHYFGKPVSELTLAESAALAGMIRSPGHYSPILHPAAARARRDVVLQRMADLGYVSRERARAAETQPLQTATMASGVARAGYFLDFIHDELASRYPEVAKTLARGGFRIFTTLDLDMQAAAEAAVANGPPRGLDARGIPDPQAALLALDPRTGAIRAYAGGRDYRASRFDHIRQAHRQPGSAFKPFLYTTVLEQGYPVTATQLDAPISFPGASAGAPPFVPTNFNGRYSGQPVDIRDAVAESNNVVAARWMAEVTPRAVIRTARRMGIESRLEDSIPLALGTSSVTPLELARAFTSLATLGWRSDPFAVVRVEDQAGHVVVPDGAFGPHGKGVLDPGVAYVMTDIMRSVLDYGTAAGLGLGRPVAGKTGTTPTDAWFVGYTPNLLAAVWVGHDDNRPLSGQGATLAAPVWHGFMARAVSALPATGWTMPADVVEVNVAPDGLLASPSQPSRPEVFLRGTEPTRTSPLGADAGGPAGAGGTAPGQAPGKGARGKTPPGGRGNTSTSGGQP